MNPVDRVVSALESRQLSIRGDDGRGYTAQCPVHDDRQASLSISIGDDGRALLRCHAGCETGDVVAALGLQMADLFPLRERDDQGAARRRQKPPKPLPTEPQLSEWAARLAGGGALLARLGELRGWTREALTSLTVGFDGERVVFPVRDRSGALVNVCRYKPKDPRDVERRDVERKMESLRARPRDLFPAPEGIAGDELLWIVEGEPDAVSARSLGLPAVGLPGVEFAKRVDVSRFARFRRVNILLDCDQPGRAAASALAEKLAASGANVRVIDLDRSRTDGYDLGDLVREASEDGPSGLAQARALLDRMAASAPPAAEHAQPISGPPANDADRVSSLVPFSQIASRPVRWAWRDRIALGKITALAGRPKIGKGLLYSHLIARVTHGTLDGDLDSARHAIIVTTEDDAGDTLKPRLVAAGADPATVSMFHMGSRDESVPFRIPQDAAELRRRVVESNAALVVIDPLVEFIDGKVDSHKSQPVRQAIASLNDIARDTGCAILVVFHLNKGTSTDPLLRHEASAAFTQVVRGGLLLGHDPDDPEGESGSRRVLATTSSNLAKLAPSLAYRIAGTTITGDTGVPIVTAAITVVGESSATGQDLLGHQGDGERTERDEAADFLREELAAGPRPVKEIKAEAKSAGIAEITLQRAKSKLGIKASKTGFNDGWEWSLNGRHEGDHPALITFDGGGGDHLRKTPVNTEDSAGAPAEGDHHMNGDHLRASEGSERTGADLDDELARMQAKLDVDQESNR